MALTLPLHKRQWKLTVLTWLCSGLSKHQWGEGAGPISSTPLPVACQLSESALGSHPLPSLTRGFGTLFFFWGGGGGHLLGLRTVMCTFCGLVPRLDGGLDAGLDARLLLDCGLTLPCTLEPWLSWGWECAAPWQARRMRGGSGRQKLQAHSAHRAPEGLGIAHARRWHLVPGHVLATSDREA